MGRKTSDKGYSKGPKYFRYCCSKMSISDIKITLDLPLDMCDNPLDNMLNSNLKRTAKLWP